MKKLYCIIILFCFVNTNSQINLIPNPSFEEDTACPNQISQVYKLKNWYSVNGTPDYFNKCYNGSGNNAKVPLNSFGYQDVPSTCNSYVGMITHNHFINGISNEIVGVKLTTPMLPNTKYYFSIKLSLANFSKRASNKFGANFYVNQPAYTPTFIPTNNAHITFTQTITDTLSWVKIFQSFTPLQNFEYISIGNFFDTLACNRIYLYNEVSPTIYYYIDDVCLSTDSAFAYNYTFNCTTTNEKELQNSILQIYPNPVSNRIKLKSEINIDDVEIIDLNMKLQIFSRKEDELIFELPEGFYFLKIYFNNQVYYKKLIINKNN